MGEQNKTEFSFFNCTFSNNSGTSGPSIHAMNLPYFVLNSSRFKYNKASKGGGAVYLYCDQTISSICSAVISDNIFIENVAAKGGALMWSGKLKPNLLKNNIFLRNEAVYGINYASFPTRIKFLIEVDPGLAALYHSDNNYSNDSALNSFTVIKEVRSGEVASWSLDIYLLDDMDQKVLNEESSITLEIVHYKEINRTIQAGNHPDNCEEVPYHLGCNLALKKLLEYYSDNSDEASPYKGNLTQVIANNKRIHSLGEGIIRLENIRVVGTPGELYFLKISSLLIEPKLTDYTYLDKSAYENIDPWENKYMLLIPLVIRLCAQGEIYRKTPNICEACANTR
jgi:hypothetical protein